MQKNFNSGKEAEIWRFTLKETRVLVFQVLGLSFPITPSLFLLFLPYPLSPSTIDYCSVVLIKNPSLHKILSQNRIL